MLTTLKIHNVPYSPYPGQRGVSDQVLGEVWNQVLDQVLESVEDKVWFPVRYPLHHQLLEDIRKVM